MSNNPVIWTPESTQEYKTTRLIDLGKNELFLEDLIVANFDVLGMQTYESGIRGPFKCWQQVPLKTPEGRTIYPDIVAISASGHFIIVEVKLGNNPELKSRKVISQIIDYTSSFAAYSPNQLVAALSGSDTDRTWGDYIEELFPDADDPSELADVLERRISSGEVNLVIAADYAPAGTKDLLKGVATQSTVGFKLELVVIRPHVIRTDATQEILFIPEREQTTEIVARTAVTITYDADGTKPGVEINTSSAEDIEDQLVKKKQGTDLSRKWSIEEVKSAFEADGHEVHMRLWDFCNEYSYQQSLIPKEKRRFACFAFYVPVPGANGKPRPTVAFSCTLSWDKAYVFMRFEGDDRLGEELNAEYYRRLTTLFNEEIDFSRKEIGVGLDDLHKEFDGFVEIMKWLSEVLSSKVVINS